MAEASVTTEAPKSAEQRFSDIQTRARNWAENKAIPFHDEEGVFNQPWIDEKTGRLFYITARNGALDIWEHLRRVDTGYGIYSDTRWEVARYVLGLDSDKNFAEYAEDREDLVVHNGVKRSGEWGEGGFGYMRPSREEGKMSEGELFDKFDDLLDALKKSNLSWDGKYQAPFGERRPIPT